MVEDFVSRGVSGIVLAPLDETALRGPVAGAMNAKIPVVIFDSGLAGQAGKDFISYVATDNFKGGQIAGEEMARELGGKGNVIVLRYAKAPTPATCAKMASSTPSPNTPASRFSAPTSSPG